MAQPAKGLGKGLSALMGDNVSYEDSSANNNVNTNAAAQPANHLPVSVIRNDLLDGHLIAMEDEWTFYDQEVRVVFPSGIMPTATRAFVDYLTNRFSMRKTRPSAQVLRRLADHLGELPPASRPVPDA